jgi:hypothetical protein
MKKDDFTQSMSHSDALSKNLGAEGFSGKTAISNFLSHYDVLPNRPDYDGFVTIDEGINWAKDHPNLKSSPSDENYSNATPNDALYINSAKINFGNLSVSDMAKLGIKEGGQGNVNLFDYTDFLSSSSRSSVFALGNTQIKLLNVTTGEVQLFNDGYDWDYHNYPMSRRNAGLPPENTRDRLIQKNRQYFHLNDSHGFPIYMYGVGTIKTE